MPRLAGAYCLAFTRVRFGFGWAVLLHGLGNGVLLAGGLLLVLLR